jgi:hypothetical protein
MTHRGISAVALAVALVSQCTPWGDASLQAQPPRMPGDACTRIRTPLSAPTDSVPNLAGLWDFAIDMGAQRATGTMALGRLDADYGGALTPDATNTVVIRRLTLRGDSIHMAVASQEGDVLFDGRLGSDRSLMCGIVTYHGGQRFTMLATQRRRPVFPPARP